MWLKNMDRLKKKYNTARKHVPAPILYSRPGAKVGVIGFGSTETAILEAIHQLDTEHGIPADFLRVRALPFTQEVTDFINRYDQVFVVEMNRDGQMKQILSIEYPEKAPNFKSVAHGDGLPAAAKWVREGVLAKYTLPAKSNGKATHKAGTKTIPSKSVKAAPKKSSGMKLESAKSLKKTSGKK